MGTTLAAGISPLSHNRFPIVTQVVNFAILEHDMANMTMIRKSDSDDDGDGNYGVGGGDADDGDNHWFVRGG